MRGLASIITYYTVCDKTVNPAQFHVTLADYPNDSPIHETHPRVAQHLCLGASPTLPDAYRNGILHVPYHCPHMTTVLLRSRPLQQMIHQRLAACFPVFDLCESTRP